MDTNKDKKGVPTCPDCGEPLKVPRMRVPPNCGKNPEVVDGVGVCVNPKCPRNRESETDEFGFPLDH